MKDGPNTSMMSHPAMPLFLTLMACGGGMDGPEEEPSGVPTFYCYAEVDRDDDGSIEEYRFGDAVGLLHRQARYESLDDGFPTRVIDTTFDSAGRMLTREHRVREEGATPEYPVSAVETCTYFETGKRCGRAEYEYDVGERVAIMRDDYDGDGVFDESFEYSYQTDAEDADLDVVVQRDQFGYEVRRSQYTGTRADGRVYIRHEASGAYDGRTERLYGGFWKATFSETEDAYGKVLWTYRWSYDASGRMTMRHSWFLGALAEPIVSRTRAMYDDDCRQPPVPVFQVPAD